MHFHVTRFCFLFDSRRAFYIRSYMNVLAINTRSFEMVHDARIEFICRAHAFSHLQTLYYIIYPIIHRIERSTSNKIFPMIFAD